MKKLQNLKGAKALNKKEQQSINGGGGGCISLQQCESECQYGGWCGLIIGTANCYSCVPSGNG